VLERQAVAGRPLAGHDPTLDVIPDFLVQIHRLRPLSATILNGAHFSVSMAAAPSIPAPAAIHF
jgi:hypothetical protein